MIFFIHLSVLDVVVNISNVIYSFKGGMFSTLKPGNKHWGILILYLCFQISKSIHDLMRRTREGLLLRLSLKNLNKNQLKSVLNGVLFLDVEADLLWYNITFFYYFIIQFCVFKLLYQIPFLLCIVFRLQSSLVELFLLNIGTSRGLIDPFLALLPQATFLILRWFLLVCNVLLMISTFCQEH